MASIKRQDLSQEQTKEDNEELFVHREIIVDPGQEPMRLDKFVTNRLEKVSRNRVQNAITVGAVIVNDKTVKSNYKIRPNDVVKVVMATEPEMDYEIKAQYVPFEVIYEDEAVLVINKPSGVVVHPGIGNKDNTLVNGLMYHFQQHPLPVLEGNSPDRPGLVHRLDKDTSGIMVIAKTDLAMQHLAKQFFDHSIERKYHALVWGNWEESEGTVDANIGRHPTSRLLQHVFPEGEEGKHAVTHFKVLKDYYYVSLVECQLETGRTHQIRVHMNYLSHPVFNDKRYGGDAIRKGTVYTKYKQFVQNCFKLCERQTLHAKSLGFIHPATGENMFFESDLPPDFQAVLDKWNQYYEIKVEKN